MFKTNTMNAKKPVNRRTAEQKEEITQLRKSILERAKRLEVTAYELSLVVDMTTPALRNILKGETKFPDLTILRQIDQYITTEYETEKSEKVAEAPAEYGTKESEKLSEILTKLNQIENKMDRASLKQDIMFEIIRNAKEAELNVINEAVSMRLSSLQGKS